MSPKAKIISAVAIIGIGAVPFVFSEVSHWWWLSHLSPNNNLGMTDGMMITAFRIIALLISAVVSGVGLAWAFLLGRSHPTVLTSTRRAAMAATAVVIGIPLTWYLVGIAT
jgi:hypothetical protein